MTDVYKYVCPHTHTHVYTSIPKAARVPLMLFRETRNKI